MFSCGVPFRSLTGGGRGGGKVYKTTAAAARFKKGRYEYVKGKKDYNTDIGGWGELIRLAVCRKWIEERFQDEKSVFLK